MANWHLTSRPLLIDFKQALYDFLLMQDFLASTSGFEFFLSYQEEILLACEEGKPQTNQALVLLLKSYPILFYQTFQRQTSLVVKNTYILSHIIEYGNVALLKLLLATELKKDVIQFFERSYYNLLYRNHHNHNFSEDRHLFNEMVSGSYWDDMIGLLVDELILPADKVEEFCTILFAKPELLKSAFDKHYFDDSYEHYWQRGLDKKNKGWVWFKMMNTSIAQIYSGMKDTFYQDFQNHALNEYLWCNNQSCLYWPDMVIYHDNDILLNEMIAYDRKAAQNWFKYRVYKINHRFVTDELAHYLKGNSLQENHERIHQQFDNPWFYLTQQNLPLEQEHKDSAHLAMNSIDYALFCQSEKCLNILLDLSGFETLLDNHSIGKAPGYLKKYWHYLKLNQHIDLAKHDDDSDCSDYIKI
jgi:hypothetical protein